MRIFSQLCLSLLICFSASLSLAAEPEAVMEQRVKYFGKVFQGDKLTHQFKIENRGDAPLEILKVTPSCGCTAAAVGSNVVAPGDSTFIKTIFDTEGFRGLKEKKISVYTNDSRNATLVFSVKAEILTEVWTEPSRLFFGSISREETRSKSFLILTDESSEVVFKKVQSRSPYLSVESRDFSGDGRKGKEISVAFKDKPPIGGFRSRVSVTTSSKKEPVINVSVLANIYGDIKMAPQSVSFGVVKPSDVASLEKVISIVNTSENPVNITEIKSANASITYSKEVVREGKEYRIKIGLKAPLKGIVQSRLIIKTDNKDPKQRDLHLPIYAIIDSESS